MINMGGKLKIEVKVLCVGCKISFDMVDCEMVTCNETEFEDCILWMCKSCMIKHEKEHGPMETSE